ncbi:MAG: HipA domain-containing protein [Robiginitomaculum sp.]|nr:HipA domain-containing protein [Robiginitomaculum sp.]
MGSRVLSWWSKAKSNAQRQDGSLAIVKFPRKDDEFNIVVWETVALRLAKQAGINVPEWRLEVILEKPVLIMRRFDRDGDKRVPFLSAMSMLDAKDNEQRSYLEIAYALVQVAVIQMQIWLSYGAGLSLVF